MHYYSTIALPPSLLPFIMLLIFYAEKQSNHSKQAFYHNARE